MNKPKKGKGLKPRLIPGVFYLREIIKGGSDWE
jgi:hypothetical protein